MDIESLFCFEQAELGLEQVVVIKRPALLSTKKIHLTEQTELNIIVDRKSRFYYC